MKEKFKELVSLGSIYAFGSVSQKILGFVFIPIYTTFLTTKDYGIIGLMSITVSMFAIIINAPIDRGLIRHYYTPEYENKRKELFFNSLLSVLIQGILMGGLFYFASGFLTKIILADDDLIYIVKIYAFILVGTLIQSLILAMLRAQKKARLYTFVNVSRVLISAVIILYLLIVRKMGLLALIYGALFSSFYDIIILFPFILKNIKWKIDFLLLKPIYVYGLPLILSALSVYLIRYGDRYVIRFYDSVSTVGLYSFGYQFGALITLFLVSPMKQIMNPMIYEMEQKPNELRVFIVKACNYYYIFAIFMCLVIALFSKDLICLIARKKEFWGGAVIVPVIAFAQVHNGLRDMLNKGVFLAKKSFHAGIPYVIAAILNLGLNFLLIPHFGILGAAFATLIAYIFLDIAAVFYSYKFFGLKYDIRKLVVITIIGVIIYFLSVIFNNCALSVRSFINVCLLICFPIILYKSGIFTLNEKKYMREAIGKIRSKGFIFAMKDIILFTPKK